MSNLLDTTKLSWIWHCRGRLLKIWDYRARTSALRYGSISSHMQRVWKRTARHSAGYKVCLLCASSMTILMGMDIACTLNDGYLPIATVEQRPTQLRGAGVLGAIQKHFMAPPASVLNAWDPAKLLDSLPFDRSDVYSSTNTDLVEQLLQQPGELHIAVRLKKCATQ